MYGLPGSPIQFGAKRAKNKSGRKSDRQKFLARQGDLFPAETYLAQAPANLRAVLEMFKVATAVELTPAGEEFFKVKP